MDPTQCLSDALKLLSNAYATGDRSEIEAAFDALADLKEWLDRGGFMPKIEYTGNRKSHKESEFVIG